MNVTRRQHYVWRHYLTAWERGGKVHVLRADGNSFEANPINIAVEKDFYRIERLSQDDEQFVRLFIEHTFQNEELSKLAMGWLNSYAAPSRARRLLLAKGVSDPEIDGLIEQVEIQSEEDLHRQIEGDAVQLLEQLRSGRTGIWQNDNDAMDLAFFLALQHLRTRGMRDRVLAGFQNGPLRDVASKIWPIFRLIFATNLGWSLFSERAGWRLRALRAIEQLRFITSDQPTLNLKPGKDHNDLALYYPISPDIAVLLEQQDQESFVRSEDNLTDDLVGMLNGKMYERSYEQVFGTDGQYLKSLV